MLQDRFAHIAAEGFQPLEIVDEDGREDRLLILPCVVCSAIAVPSNAELSPRLQLLDHVSLRDKVRDFVRAVGQPRLSSRLLPRSFGLIRSLGYLRTRGFVWPAAELLVCDEAAAVSSAGGT